jgi:hypothetical protein
MSPSVVPVAADTIAASGQCGPAGSKTRRSPAEWVAALSGFSRPWAAGHGAGRHTMSTKSAVSEPGRGTARRGRLVLLAGVAGGVSGQATDQSDTVQGGSPSVVGSGVDLVRDATTDREQRSGAGDRPGGARTRERPPGSPPNARGGWEAKSRSDPWGALGVPGGTSGLVGLKRPVRRRPRPGDLTRRPHRRHRPRPRDDRASEVLPRTGDVVGPAWGRSNQISVNFMVSGCRYASPVECSSVLTHFPAAHRPRRQPR